MLLDLILKYHRTNFKKMPCMASSVVKKAFDSVTFEVVKAAPVLKGIPTKMLDVVMKVYA